jgi:hypothetical protein
VFIELVDTLRCPVAHEETWLVAAVSAYHGRFIARGALGCPVCHAQFRVDEGAVTFAEPRERPGTVRVPTADEVGRAQALLGLSEPGGTVALVGHAANLVHELEEVSQVAILLVNPAGIVPRPGLSVVWCRESVPLAAGSLRGVMVGEGTASALLPSLVRALRPRGRLVAPVGLAVPLDIVELARDGVEWVGERQGGQTSPPVGLRRR